MRTIKFRGKALITGKWIYGGFHKHIVFTPAIYPSKEEAQKDIEKHTHYLIISDTFSDYCMQRNIQATEVAPETVGQFTGLHDKKGKEIYEGDILKVDWMRSLAYVEYHRDSIMVYSCNSIGRYLGEVAGDCTVVGNIHDNPELLKEK